MFVTRITCDSSRPGMDVLPCPHLDVLADKPEDIPAAFTRTLAEAGWTTSDDGYHCPRHNPDLSGLRIILGQDYIELIPGVRLRLLDDQIAVKAEILLDKSRYDIDDHGASTMWRAKHASEDWPA